MKKTGKKRVSRSGGEFVETEQLKIVVLDTDPRNVRRMKIIKK